jgi:hypothetical protein
MPKPTIFSVGIQGKQRLLFSIQERAAGDLTIVIKQSKFSTKAELAQTDENAAVIEERYSIHRSPESEDINVIKWTEVLKNGRVRNTRNYTQAIKRYGLFAVVFIRRAGDLSDSRYVVNSSRGRIVSLGEYDPVHFQPVFLLLAGAASREFEPPLDTGINCTQVRFKYFRIVLLWQFLMLNGYQTSRTLIPKTFTQEEIDAAKLEEREAMSCMAFGFAEGGAINTFNRLKYQICDLLLDSLWNKLSGTEKKENDLMSRSLRIAETYSCSGLAFTQPHRMLLKGLNKVRLSFQTSSIAPLKDSVKINDQFDS